MKMARTLVVATMIGSLVSAPVAFGDAKHITGTSTAAPTLTSGKMIVVTTHKSKKSNLGLMVGEKVLLIAAPTISQKRMISTKRGAILLTGQGNDNQSYKIVTASDLQKMGLTKKITVTHRTTLGPSPLLVGTINRVGGDKLRFNIDKNIKINHVQFKKGGSVTMWETNGTKLQGQTVRFQAAPLKATKSSTVTQQL